MICSVKNQCTPTKTIPQLFLVPTTRVTQSHFFEYPSHIFQIRLSETEHIVCFGGCFQFLTEKKVFPCGTIMDVHHQCNEVTAI